METVGTAEVIDAEMKVVDADIARWRTSKSTNKY